MSLGYEVTKWLHVISSTVLFGTGLGTAFHLWMTYRRGSVAEVARAAKNTVLADWLFTLPAGLIQPLTGWLLIRMLDLDPWSDWLVATYGLYILAFLCWTPVVVIQIKVAAQSAAAAEAAGPLPSACHRLMGLWFCLGWPAFLSMIAIFWLMVAKPSLWS